MTPLRPIHRPPPPPPGHRPAVARLPLGCAAVDQAIGGGLAFGAIHELVAADAQDAAALAGLATALAASARAQHPAGCCWIGLPASAGARLCPRGLVELAGTLPIDLVVTVPDAPALLRAAHRAARRPGLVIVERRGAFPLYDLTASRRLHLAAEASGALLLMLGIGGRPTPSAARTRWAVAAAPSAPLEARAPGPPAFDLTLLRQRGGPAGAAWRLAWNREARAFHEQPRDAALPGAVVSPPPRRAAPAAGARLAG